MSLNPVALLAPALLLGVVNALTISTQTHVLTLAVTLTCVPLLRIPTHIFLRTTWPLGVAALTLLVVNTLADPAPGLSMSDLETGVTISLRLLAITLPGLVAFMVIEPVGLVDALVQYVHIPARFGYGALAAMRLIPVLSDDLRTRRMALRARGAAPTGVWGRILSVRAILLGLLVTAIRRATRLATALDARGFDSLRRTTARPSPWTVRDTAWCVSGLIVSVAIVSAGIVTGGWQGFGIG